MNVQLKSTPSPTKQEQSLLSLLEQYLERVESETDFDRKSWIDSACNDHPSLDAEIRDGAHQIDSLSLLATNRPTSQPEVAGYSILRRLGQGGVGIVYEAVENRLHRKVALKVFPAVFDRGTKAHARFMVEAQAAASLDHPHIVPVYAVGGEPTKGEPCYLSMKLINGESLDHWVARSGCENDQIQNADRIGSLGTPARVTKNGAKPSEHAEVLDRCLNWMIAAADALGEAHACGVIHRDIKPSNLMVDQDDHLWVTDFGLARLAALQNGDTLTQSGDRVGTLAYMSPQQAAGEPVDQRTDIYSLGLTILELLTGRRMISGETVSQCQRDRDQTEAFHLRDFDRSFDRDLDVVLAKATAADVNDRYQTVTELAEDLKRYRRGEPIQAKLPSLGVRAMKWTRRHRKLVVTVATALLILVGSSWIVLAKLAIANRQTHEALQSSQQNLQRTEDILDKFGLLAAEKLRDVKGAETVRQELLKQTLLYYEDYAKRTEHDESFAEQRAITYFKAAQIIDEIGADSDAIQTYEQAARLFDQVVDLSPRGERVRWLTWNDLAVLRAESGEYEQATSLYKRALAAIDRAQKEYADLEHGSIDRARVFGNDAMLQIQTGNFDDATNKINDGLQAIRGHVDPESETLRAMLLSQLSFLLKDSASSESVATCDRVIDILQRQPADPEVRRMLTTAHANRAAMHHGNLEVAQQNLANSKAILESMETTQAHDRTYLTQVASIGNDLGRVLAQRGDLKAAIAEFDSAERTLRRLREIDPHADHYAVSLAGVLHNLGRAHASMGAFDEAYQKFQQSLELQKLVSADPSRLTEPMRQTGRQLLAQTIADLKQLEQQR